MDPPCVFSLSSYPQTEILSSPRIFGFWTRNFFLSHQSLLCRVLFASLVVRGVLAWNFPPLARRTRPPCDPPSSHTADRHEPTRRLLKPSVRSAVLPSVAFLDPSCTAKPGTRFFFSFGPVCTATRSTRELPRLTAIQECDHTKAKKKKEITTP